MAFTACNDTGKEAADPSDNPSQSESQAKNPNANTNPAMVPNEAGGTAPNENTVPDSGYVFELTENEEALYKEYLEKNDMEIFRDVDPISIAKIHLMYGVKGEWKAEYSMYYKETKMKLTEEEFEQVYIKEAKTNVPEVKKSLANWYFPFIDEGTFKTEGDAGVIHFLSVPEEGDAPEDCVVNFHMYKDSTGLWWVQEDPVIAG